jgi:hypothetical protein
VLITKRARPPCILEGPPGRVGLGSKPAPDVVDLAEQQPRFGQTERVVQLGQPGDGLLRLPVGRLGAPIVGVGL